MRRSKLARNCETLTGAPLSAALLMRKPTIRLLSDSYEPEVGRLDCCSGRDNRSYPRRL
jgi:hypothetical protein